MQREAEVRAGKAVGSGLSTTFTPMSDWITDRPPTEADGDRDGDVWVRTRPDQEIGFYVHWSIVGIGTPWQRSHFWRPPAPQIEPEPEPEPAAPATEPRRFVSVSRTLLSPIESIIDAIDDEGVAWTRKSFPFPPQPSWQRIDPLPAREVPPF